MSDSTPRTHPGLPQRQASERKTVVLKFSLPGHEHDASAYLDACVARLEPILNAHEAVVRETNVAGLALHVDLPRKQALSFKTRALELLGNSVTATEFEDTTKPFDQELGAGQ